MRTCALRGAPPPGPPCTRARDPFNSAACYDIIGMKARRDVHQRPDACRIEDGGHSILVCSMQSVGCHIEGAEYDLLESFAPIYVPNSRFRHLREQLVMLSRFGDIWMGFTCIDTSEWSGSCSEEGLLFESALPRLLYVTA